MSLPDSSSLFNKNLAFAKSRLLPFTTLQKDLPISCSNCRFINLATNNFCTNCGYPVYPNKDRLNLYYLRLGQRKNMQRLALTKISNARNALYILATCCMLGFFYLFSAWKEVVFRGLIMVILGVVYAALARWSLQKPVTSLLIGLIIMLTFAAIYIWAEITSLFNSPESVFLLIIQVILIYFLVGGVKAAFQADILEEEFKT